MSQEYWIKWNYDGLSEYLTASIVVEIFYIALKHSDIRLDIHQRGFHPIY